ncbi:threonine ammonia-lyase [Geothermobacter hydrogeniphilus]|uniref:Threonine ammonia-lyase n=1 Tax=Geothermobacter hydrogeniphilus TaxID=1969733 RepID=A0A1X0XSD7_9BACT|nr:threonine ammonia-lyase [Geothermobacter hydrogeniphilus]ORJ55832.1 threonine ammonia-lyase [Geothermobacter hydrogeniphilus]
MLDLKLIQQAAARLEGQVRRTPLLQSAYFSQKLGRPLLLKCENLQRTGSFKLRGAYNFLACQPRKRIAPGVITASAGNHAQGVAHAAQLFQIPATVVMPVSTPLAKEQATRHYGAEVILHGENYDAAAAHARQLQRQNKLVYLPAFDHRLVIAGQGTIGLEIHAQRPDLAALLVPIGGGGLISGVASALKALNPRIRIIGVEAAGAAGALHSRRSGKRVRLASTHSLADGIVVKQLGAETFPLIEELVDHLLTVEEEEIAQAIVGLLEKTKLVVEGSAAVTLAALLFHAPKLPPGPVACLLSGGNIDVQTLSRVVQRGMIAEGRFLKILVNLDDAPGNLARLSQLLAGQGANILHVHHDRRLSSIPLGRAEVLLELETRGPEHIAAILDALHRQTWGAEVLH